MASAARLGGATTNRAKTRSFRPPLFTFLRELAANNDRSWFNANKDRYERDVRDPALAFISDFAPHLARISEHFFADPRPVGGSLFRIQRDVRFSRDKTPYKPMVGIQFRHEQAKDAHAPGFYLHLQPRQVFAAAGIWRPDSAALHDIRAAIAAEPDRWHQLAAQKTFAAHYRLEGESLKRPPAGYPADHPLIEDLKRKDFIAVTKLSERAATSRGFVESFAALCETANPFVSFLSRSLGVAH